MFVYNEEISPWKALQRKYIYIGASVMLALQISHVEKKVFIRSRV